MSSASGVVVDSTVVVVDGEKDEVSALNVGESPLGFHLHRLPTLSMMQSILLGSIVRRRKPPRPRPRRPPRRRTAHSYFGHVTSTEAGTTFTKAELTQRESSSTVEYGYLHHFGSQKISV